MAIGAAGGLLLVGANELLGLGLFDDGYLGSLEAGPFALRLGVVLAASVGLSLLVERFNG